MAIFGLWRNWVVAVGLLTMLTILAPIVSQQWLVMVNLACFFALKWAQAVLRKRDVPSCAGFLSEVSTIIVITAIVIVVIMVLAENGLFMELNGQPYSNETPLIVILITAPVACLITVVNLLKKGEPKVCGNCRIRNGNLMESGFVGMLFRKEWKYQTSMLFMLSLMLCIVDWGYYLVQYVNVNLNQADKFFFIWLPLTMYVLSLIYLGGRYYSMWIYYCQDDEAHIVERPGKTTLRFLLLRDDKMFVNFYGTEKRFTNGAKVKRFDTPVVISTDYHERENLPQAISLFESETGIKDAEIKPIYCSSDEVTCMNVFHYFAFVDSIDSVADSSVEGEWMTWGNLRQLASQGLLSREFAAELERIYSVSMAWKTYDSEGHRLYDIKHYKPTFRLRDIRNWDVDYNDRRWLRISKHNEDNFCFKFRKLFSRKLNVNKH